MTKITESLSTHLFKNSSLPSVDNSKKPVSSLNTASKIVSLENVHHASSNLIHKISTTGNKAFLFVRSIFVQIFGFRILSAEQKKVCGDAHALIADMRNVKTMTEENFFERLKKVYPEIDMYYSGDEYKKLKNSFFCLFWIMRGEHAKFIENQPATDKLSKASFDLICQRFNTLFPTETAIDALFTKLALHDSAKDKKFKDQFNKILPNVHGEDHDDDLKIGVHKAPQMFPSYQRQPAKYRDIIKSCLNMRFNGAQLIQGENLPANLKSVTAMAKKNLPVFEFYNFFEEMDMAGNAGFVNMKGSMVLKQSVFDFLEMARHRVINTDECTAKFSKPSSHAEINAYNAYLQDRASKWDMGLNVEKPQDRALTRLCCMARIETKADATLMKNALDKLIKEDYDNLVSELNKTGFEKEPTILIYYAPKVVELLLKSKTVKKEDALLAAVYNLSLIFKEVRKDLPKTAKGVHQFDVFKIAVKLGAEPYADIRPLIEAGKKEQYKTA
jgi:hypothetical protein